MQQHRKVRLATTWALTAALALAAFGAADFARPAAAAGNMPITTSAKKAGHIEVTNVHQVEMSRVPQASAADLAKPARSVPVFYPMGQKAHALAQHRAGGSAAPNTGASPPTITGKSAGSVALPSVYNLWDGQKDSAATCPYSHGCQPPDMGLAANGAGQVMQSVNTSLALYDIIGTIQPGWPKTAQAFFGVPNPGSPTACDPNGPYLSYPRSWWDPYRNRWGQAILQVEGAFGLNICPFQTKYWVAISNTSNPNGTWTIFAINMAFGSDPTGFADFAQFGFDAEGIFLSANVFNNAGTTFEYAEIVGCGYPTNLTTCNGWSQFTMNGTIQLDSLNPTVDSLNAGARPGAELFATVFNGLDPSGDDCVTRACHGAVVLAWADPIGANHLTSRFVDTTLGYLEPPGADQPSCPNGAGCIDTGDLRFSGTPFYSHGSLYAANTNGCLNAFHQLAACIHWYRFKITLDSTGGLTNLVVAEDNVIFANANTTTFPSLMYPVLAADLDGDILMGYDYTGDSIYPSINVTSKNVTDPDGIWSGGPGFTTVAGTVNTTNTAWGAYTAMSYNAPYQDFIWLASEYPNPTTGDWNTKVMRLKIAFPR